MRILPVLDLMDHHVVRGIAGRRHLYAPIVSRLAGSTRPLDLAQAFHEHFGFDELYLADLDAIAGKPLAAAIYAELLRQGFTLWVDAGAAWEALADVGVQHIVAGLESLEGPGQLRELIDRYSSLHVVFSLDLRDSSPLGSNTWNGRDSWEIAKQAVELGVRRMLVLDLAAVGMKGGTPTQELCARLRSTWPQLEITTGGGVRGVHDLQRLRDLGVDNVLIASALHDGCLTVANLADFRGANRAR